MLYWQFDQAPESVVGYLIVWLAWPRPRAWDFKESAMSIPELSSAALLIRRPLDIRSKDVVIPSIERFKYFVAVRAAVLSLILSTMLIYNAFAIRLSGRKNSMIKGKSSIGDN